MRGEAERNRKILITACAITRNEEKNLPSWLASVSKIADEIVVVDTGSEDGTVDIARSGGAMVYHFDWIDDFASAKNFAIEKAHGEWILFIDADEFFPDDVCEKVRLNVMRNSHRRDIAGLLCRRENIDSVTGKMLSGCMILPIFRNIPNLRYEGRIHELLRDVSGGSPNLKVAEDIHTIHTGFSSDRQEEKYRRNIDMILRERERRGEKRDDAIYLSDGYYGIGDYESAARWAKRAIDDGVVAVGMEGRTYLILIESMIFMKKPLDTILDTAREAEEKFPGHAEFPMLAGIALCEAGLHERGAGELQRGIKMNDENIVKGSKAGSDAAKVLLPSARNYAEEAKKHIRSSKKHIKISACVITKNEEKNLPAWLSCVKKIADEIIVVDTGSDDGTVAVAKNGGAKVFHFEWINDFAAAKNYAIDCAEGDWIVFLDADETFPAKDCPKVREWIRSSDKDEKNAAMMFRRIEIDSDTGTVKGSTLVVRAFRNLPTLRYEGRIHEVLVTEEKTKPALIFNPDVVINHTGYSSSVMREKLERNLDILLSEEKRRGKMPSDDFYLADCYFGLKQFEKAAECARRAIDSDVSLFGDSGRAYSVLIQSLSGMGKLREALAANREAQKKFPDLPEFLVQGGLLRYQMKDYDEAERELSEGLAMYRDMLDGRREERIADDGCAPLVKFAESALREMKKIRDEAGAKNVKKNKFGEKFLASCREAVYDALDRKDYGAAKNAIDELMKVSEREALGLYVNLFIEMNDASNARKALDAYLPTAPKDVYTRFLSARVRLMTGEHLKVIEELRPIEDDKSIDGATREKILNLLGQCYRFIGDSEKATKAYLEASRVTKDKMLAALEYSDYLFNSHYLPVVSLSDEREKAAAYDKFFDGVNGFYHRRRYPKEKGEKIKIGYISPDIRNHVVLRFSLAFFMNYDRERYTVIVYMNGAEDAWSDKIHETADGWCNITGLPPERVARCIYDDGIDILVDLAGHTKNNSLPALSYKPAPIIVSGIGYFASTGLSAVDYFIGDRFLDGDGDSPAQQEAFTEKLLVLPRSHFCYAPLYRAPDIGDAPCTKNGYITFGSFNNFTKVNDDVLGTWRIIMEQVPGSRLLLKAGVFAREDTRGYVIERLKRAGIDVGRVEMRPLTRDYLAEYNDVDIALDTFPYPGGGTSCDALYMGVPLVTLAGATHGGRFGASLMANMGMAELVARTVDEYVAKAVSLANDMELLSVMRKTMRRMMQRSPLMDAGQYMKDVESAYERIYSDFVAEQDRKLNDNPPTYSEANELMKLAAQMQAEGDKRQLLAVIDLVMAAHVENRDLLRKIAAIYIDGIDAMRADEVVHTLMTTGNVTGYDYFLAASAAFIAKEYDRAFTLVNKALDDESLVRWVRGASYHLRADIYSQLGDQGSAAEDYRLSSEHKDIDNGKLVDYSNYLFCLGYEDIPRDKFFEESKKYDDLVRQIKRYRHSPHDEKRRHKKIRVGYISPDFCGHVVSSFAKAFFFAFDKNRFEVYGYANCAEDKVSREFECAADVWRNVKDIPAGDVAKIIHDDEIDILFELAGHTGFNELNVMSYKPAPVAICGIGYYETTGLKDMDYFLVDQHTAPDGEERYFSEKLLRLPHSHFCYNIFGDMPMFGALPCRKKGHVTFGCLNKVDKITDNMISAWGKILNSVDGSRLFLKAKAYEDEKLREDMLARLEGAGISRERVKLEGYTADYYNAYNEIDIALDTYPFPGGGTTCDALYMGVPVVTMTGRPSSHHKRFGASLLTNIGLDDLIAETYDEYAEKAVTLANDIERLVDLRQTLRRRMGETAVIDPKIYMADVEDAYGRIWGEWEKNIFNEKLIKEKTDELQRAADDENWREVARLGTRLYYAGALPDDKIHMIAYAYQGMEDYGRTVFWCDRALEAQRGAGDLLFMKANALNLDGRLGESMSLCDAALDLMRRNHKEDGEFYLPFLRLKAEVSFKLGLPDAGEYNKEAYENENTIKGRLDSYSGYLLASHLREIDRDELFERHIGYAKIIDGEHIKQFTSYSHKSGNKIRVGYISPDFRLHVMFHFILPFFAAHDSGRFEIYAYRVGDEKEDKITKIFKSMAAQWRDVSMMSYADAANVIHEDGIDILFDIAGHSARSGLPVLAYRPAPVQISGIGYMATTGLKAVDCFLTDSFVDPEGLNDDYFTEKLIRVTSHFCYSGVTNVAPSDGAPMKKKGYVTFGVFNHMRKYIENDRLLAAWREIMTLVPGARLLLKCQVYFSLTTIDFAYEKLKSAGIDMERVTFEPATVEYMSRYNDVDIALDTYPYPGGGTTCDALYMGVPVISLYGERHSTRFGYSLLNNVGIGELAVKSYEDYVARAVMLAGDEELLDVLHKKLRRMVMESPVMDSGRYMKEVEALYEGLYRTVQ